MGFHILVIVVVGLWLSQVVFNFAGAGRYLGWPAMVAIDALTVVGMLAVLITAIVQIV